MPPVACTLLQHESVPNTEPDAQADSKPNGDSDGSADTRPDAVTNAESNRGAHCSTHIVPDGVADVEPNACADARARRLQTFQLVAMGQVLSAMRRWCAKPHEAYCSQGCARWPGVYAHSR